MQEMDFFKRKRVDLDTLQSFGFTLIGTEYVYQSDIIDGQFSMQVSISSKGMVDTKIFDKDTGEEYALHRIPEATGAFVGRVRSDYTAVLARIAENCFEPDVFKSRQARELMSYVHKRYGDELEFLWQKFPENAIWRRNDTEKWYGALLTVEEHKLGLESGATVEIIDLRIDSKEMVALVDGRRYFPGYHMNKKNWFTIILNDSVPTDEICRRIDASYCLAGGCRKKACLP